MISDATYAAWLRNPSAKVVNLVEIDYNGDSAVYPGWTTYTLKLSDVPFPPYKDVVASLPTLSRQIGGEFSAEVSASVGHLVLNNLDGALDSWPQLSIDGQHVRLYHGDPSWAAADFRLVSDCVAEGVSGAAWDTITIQLRGIDHGANLPIQTRLLPTAVGANAPSANPIPLAFGQIFNAQPPCVDEINQIYQWNDGAVTSVSDVRDSGISFKTAQIAISAINVGSPQTSIFSTATPHGFYRDTRVRCDVGTMPSNTTWIIASWNGDVFCTLGYLTDIAATSKDGIHWTQHTLPVSDKWTGISWNGNVFCAVAIGGTTVVTSPDGATWTLHALPVSASWSAIAWNGTVFCAISTGPSSVCATSPDGASWTQHALPASASWTAIVWNGSVFCAVSSSGSTIAGTSPDGEVWTQQTLPVSADWIGIAWNGHAFCAIGYSSSIAATSADGASWTQQTLPVNQSWYRIAWSGTVFCAVALNSSIAATSPDGVSWTEQTLPASAVWTAITWNGSIFCLLGYGIQVTISADGVAWSPLANTLPAPLAINTDYWVSASNLTATDFMLAATRGGATIDIIGNTSGAPLVGFHWTADLATGKIYCDSKPVGVLTLDGIAGDTEAGNILPTVLAATNVDATSKAAFLVTCPQAVGIYIKDRKNRLDVANEISSGLAAWYGYRRDGKLYFGRVEASYGSHDHELIADEGTLNTLTIEKMVPPRKQNRLQYRHNWTNQQGALAATVSAEQRALFSTDYSVSAPNALGADEGPAGQEFHVLAEIPDAKSSLIYLASDAGAEAARLDTLYYGWGAVFSWEIGRVGVEVDIGEVVNVVHPRYGLSGGVRMPVVAVEDDPTAGTTKLKFFAALAAYTPGQL